MNISDRKNPLLGVSQLGELKIKVHLPIHCSGRMSTNPDKVVNVEKAKPLILDTISGQIHLQYQKERKIELKLSRFKLDLEGKQEQL